MMKRNCRKLLLVIVGMAVAFASGDGYSRRTWAAAAKPAAQAQAEKPFVIEYYYKTKWGYADEFISLFKKNHFPLLRKQIEMGRILEVHAVQPRYHMTEEERWDYRVTIVFKNAEVANDNFDASGITEELYPDQGTYKKEEQRRFAVLDAHWDLPIKDVDLTAK